jgi:hypothetical protein
MNKGVAVGLFVAACLNLYSPGFNGIFFDPVKISVGEGRIIAAIFIVGAAVVWFMPPAKE